RRSDDRPWYVQHPEGPICLSDESALDAVRVEEPSDDLGAVVDPAGKGEEGAGDVDRLVGPVAPHAAVRLPTRVRLGAGRLIGSRHGGLGPAGRSTSDPATDENVTKESV